jgi:hypothetical protein
MILAEKMLKALRPAFSRERTFEWFVVAAIGLMCGADNTGMAGGVAGIVRILGLSFSCYGPLGHFFRSAGVDIPLLEDLWAKVAASLPCLEKTSDGRVVLAGDGLKQPKEGSRMPGVKRQRQESGNSSKPERFFGHLWGMVGVVAQFGGQRHCILLSAHIQNGLAKLAGLFGKAGKEEGGKQHENSKLAGSFGESRAESHVMQCVGDACKAALRIGARCVCVFDAYFLSVGAVLLAKANPLFEMVVRCKASNIACFLPEEGKKRGRGRPPKVERGEEVKIFSLFGSMAGSFSEVEAELYGKPGKFMMLCLDMLWGDGHWIKMRFVLVDGPLGKMALACTGCTIPPEEILRLYGLRFSIEVSFKALKHVVAGMAYRFWSKSMPKLDRFAPKGSPGPLEAVAEGPEMEKVAKAAKATGLWALIGCISLGILQAMPLECARLGFNPMLRFQRTQQKVCPSVDAVSHGLRLFMALCPETAEDSITRIIRSYKMEADEAGMFFLQEWLIAG